MFTTNVIEVLSGDSNVGTTPLYRYFHKIAKYAKIAQTQVEKGWQKYHAKRSKSAD